MNIKRRILIILGCLLAFTMTVGIISGVVLAAEKRTVRVAFFPMDGYNMTAED